MALPNIVLAGGNGSGKDTVAQLLFEEYGYTRMAFADPLRSLAMLNPDYASMVNAHGYEGAKRTVPEVREYLIALGEGVRQGDPNYFVRCLDKRWDRTKPTVITDARNQIEMDWALSQGFKPLALRKERVQLPEVNIPDWAIFIDNDESLAALRDRVMLAVDIADWGSSGIRTTSER